MEKTLRGHKKYNTILDKHASRINESSSIGELATEVYVELKGMQ